MEILALAPLAYFMVVAAAGLIAGHYGTAEIADRYEKEAGVLGHKNRKAFEAELDKLAGILRTREGKAELAKEGIELEQLLLNDPYAKPSAPEGGLPEELMPDLEPTGGVEVDGGALLADSLGVSRDQVKQAAALPTSPAVSLFGSPGSLSGEGR